MLRHRFVFTVHCPSQYSPLLRPSFQSHCLHARIPSSLIRAQSPAKRPSSTSSLSPRSFFPPSLHKPRDRKVRKTKPLPLSPSRIPYNRRQSRLILYTLAFLLSGALTYTALQPDNHVNHVFHGIVRCSRIGIALVQCVYDYRMTMRRKYTDEEEKRIDLSECHTRCATRTLKVFEKNGGIYIKLGQHLAALSYLIPIEWVSTMSVLQDACPPTPLSEISTLYLHDTGHLLTDDFTYFSSTPLGVASLAQVHRATLKPTSPSEPPQEVAVKIQHPQVARFSSIDIVTTRFIFATIQRWFPEIELRWLAEEMEISLPQELDFERELENANTTRMYFERIPESMLKIPDMLWAKKRILVMEYIEGTRVDNLEYLSQHNISPMAVSSALAAIFDEMTFISGHLHCDPHLGNVFIRPSPPASSTTSSQNFEIVLLDHGLYRQLPNQLRVDYAHLWLSIIKNDIPAMRHYAEIVAGVPPEKFPLFASAITGRDYGGILKGGDVLQVPRSIEEVRKIKKANVGGDLMLQIVDLLSQMPRIMLLLLKTNDLTRALDESLHIESSERNFLIMTKYCAKAVFLDRLSKEGNWGKLGAWWEYLNTLGRVAVYGWWLDLRSRRYRFFVPRLFDTFWIQ